MCAAIFHNDRITSFVINLDKVHMILSTVQCLFYCLILLKVKIRQFLLNILCESVLSVFDLRNINNKSPMLYFLEHLDIYKSACIEAQSILTHTHGEILSKSY